MKLFIVVVLAMNGVYAATRKEVCCGDLGCFNTDGIFFDLFYRPLSSNPNCNVVAKFKLHLNTRLNANVSQLLDPYAFATVQSSNFNTDLETKILIHGFTDHYNWDWWKVMVSALLDDGDFNVIRLDWSSGNTPPYMQATANTRLAGAYLAKFINLLKADRNYSPSKIHIIGHSLGAHVAGYTGELVEQVARISGIDPAGLYFHYMNPRVRLDPTDALVVDTLITDGESILSLGFGSEQAMGHINFYANGGSKQPGCGGFLTGTLGPSSFNSSDWELSAAAMQTVYQTVGCNHWRALSLYTESIGKGKCPMRAHKCDTYENYLLGKCRGFDGDNLALMGYYADVSFAQNGVAKNYFTQTTDRPPFCTKSYLFGFDLQNKTSSNNAREERGIVFVTLYGLLATSKKVQLTPEVVSLAPGAHLKFLFLLTEEIGKLQSVVFSWEAHPSILDLFRKHYLVMSETLIVEDDNGHQDALKLDPQRTQIQEKTNALATLANVKH